MERHLVANLCINLNFCFFSLQVEALHAKGYNAQDYVSRNPELAQVVQQLGDGTFSKSGNPDEFKDVLNNLLYHDRYLTFADYDAYIEAQDKVNACYMVSRVLSKFVKLIKTNDYSP